MTSTLEIWREDKHVGEVIREGGRLTLRYDADYSGHPLSLSLPVGAASHAHNVVHAYLDGLLPDSITVRESWGRRFGVRPTSVFGLLGAVGRDTPGAFSFLPEGETPDLGTVVEVTEDDIAERIRVLGLDRSRWLPSGNAGQFSLAGAQAKFALHRFPDGRWGEATGMQPSTHILKPATSRDFEEMDAVEDISMDVARRVALPTAPSEVVHFGSQRALVVARYDRRRRVDGSVERIHQEDLCQALGVAPEKKYSADGGPTAADLLRLIHEESDSPVRDESTFVRALAVNVALRGTDAHAKNYSILHTDVGGVRLAPLYDVISYLPYAEGRELKGLRSAMGIGGETIFDKLRTRHWVRLAERSGVDADSALTYVRDTAELVPDALREAIAGGGADVLDRQTTDLWLRRVEFAARQMTPAPGAPPSPGP